MNKYNFAFFGTPKVASDTLEILLKAGYAPKVIITSPDKRSGRGMHTHETPVSLWAKSHDIKCLKPEKINDEFIEELRSFDLNLSIVIAYGKIIPQSLISLPHLGTINIHYSLLPKYRGASPVEESLLNGDSTTGVSIQQMEYVLDSGPLIAEKTVEIESTETKTKLLQRLTQIGGELLIDKLPQIFEKNIIPIKQDDNLATFCKKLKKENGLIDIHDNAITNYNKYRAFTDWPGVYFFVEKDNKKIRIKIKQARYENDSFIIERVIPEGKKEMSYEDYLRSNI